MLYLLDTDTCIELMRRNRKIAGALASHSLDDLAIPAVTSYELYTGVEKSAKSGREKEKVDLLCETVTVLNFDFQASIAAAKIRADLESNGQMIGPYDVLIAAHAKSLALTLVTANTREFQRVDGLRIENWQ